MTSSQMNTKTYYELANVNVIGRSAAAAFERVRWWISCSKLIHEGKTFCFRTYEQLAEEIGVSVSTARRAIARLVNEGWLLKVRLKASKWNQTNCYAFGENAPESVSEPQTTRSVHPERNEDINPDGSLDKKSSIKRKIKNAQEKARKFAKGFGKKTFRESKPKGLCKACEGTGFVSDDKNNGYRCICADGRSKSRQIPPVPEALYLSLRTQLQR